MASYVSNRSAVERFIDILTPLEQELLFPRRLDVNGRLAEISRVTGEALKQYAKQFGQTSPSFGYILENLKCFGLEKNQTLAELAELGPHASGQNQQGSKSSSRKMTAEEEVLEKLLKKEGSMIAKNLDPLFLEYIIGSDAESAQYVESVIHSGASGDEILRTMRHVLIAQMTVRKKM